MPGSIRCRERRTAIRASEPSRLSPVRPSVHPSRPVSSAPLLRPDGLRSIPLQSPAAPTTPDRLPGHAPLRSASYGTARLLAAGEIQCQDSTAGAAASKRLDSTIGHPAYHAPTSVRMRASYPARADGKDVKIYQVPGGSTPFDPVLFTLSITLVCYIKIIVYLCVELLNNTI